MWQVGRYLGYTGRDADGVKAARDPISGQETAAIRGTDHMKNRAAHCRLRCFELRVISTMTEIPPAPVGLEGYYVGNPAQASAFLLRR